MKYSDMPDAVPTLKEIDMAGIAKSLEAAYDRIDKLTEALKPIAEDLKCIHYVRARKALEE